jgi:hypothetical protein
VNLEALLGEEIRDLLLVDLDVAAPDEEGAVRGVGDAAHDLVHRQRQNAGAGLVACARAREAG